MASRQLCDEMRGVTRFGVGIGHSERKCHLAHERDVRQVIADAGAGGWLDLQPCAEFFEHWELVLGALVDVLYAELTATHFDHLRFPAGDHGNLNPGACDLLDAQTVADVKQLERLAARAEVEAPIGHDTVDIQHQQSNGGRGFSWHEGRRFRTSEAA
jgi:hypothetical protein